MKEKQESPPKWPQEVYRPWRSSTHSHVLSGGRGGSGVVVGTSCPVWGGGYPCPVRGIPCPVREEYLSLLGYPEKEPGTRGWSTSPRPLDSTWGKHTENITFPRTSFAVGNKTAAQHFKMLEKKFLDWWQWRCFYNRDCTGTSLVKPKQFSSKKEVSAKWRECNYHCWVMVP